MNIQNFLEIYNEYTKQFDFNTNLIEERFQIMIVFV